MERKKAQLFTLPELLMLFYQAAIVEEDDEHVLGDRRALPDAAHLKPRDSLTSGFLFLKFMRIFAFPSHSKTPLVCFKMMLLII